MDVQIDRFMMRNILPSVAHFAETFFPMFGSHCMTAGKSIRMDLETQTEDYTMNTATATDRINSALRRLETGIGEPVFDEWALVEKNVSGWKLIEYGGSRKEKFLADFKTDMAALRETLDPAAEQVGDFAFSHEGYGSGFDAHICAGKNLFILFNNTTKSTGEITSNPKWKASQIHFTELLEACIADPIQL
jgi:hypothetical protein